MFGSEFRHRLHRVLPLRPLLFQSSRDILVHNFAPRNADIDIVVIHAVVVVIVVVVIIVVVILAAVVVVVPGFVMSSFLLSLF